MSQTFAPDGDNMNGRMAVTKIDAARRQLDCAIRLFFDDDDSLAVHTLAYARV